MAAEGNNTYFSVSAVLYEEYVSKHNSVTFVDSDNSPEALHTIEKSILRL